MHTHVLIVCSSVQVRTRLSFLGEELKEKVAAVMRDDEVPTASTVTGRWRGILLQVHTHPPMFKWRRTACAVTVTIVSDGSVMVGLLLVVICQQCHLEGRLGGAGRWGRYLRVLS